MRYLIRCLPLLALAACTTLTDPAKDLSARAARNADHPAAAAFSEVCLADSNINQWFARAAQGGWIVADDATLAKHGVASLRKRVLEIPGGGAHVTETQALFQKTEASAAFLALETVSRRDGGNSARCAMHLPGADALAVCASLGRLVGAEPDRNRKYENGRHFIQWEMHHSGMPVRIGCDIDGVPPTGSMTVLHADFDLSTPKLPPAPTNAPPTAEHQ